MLRWSTTPAASTSPTLRFHPPPPQLPQAVKRTKRALPSLNIAGMSAEQRARQEATRAARVAALHAVAKPCAKIPAGDANAKALPVTSSASAQGWPAHRKQQSPPKAALLTANSSDDCLVVILIGSHTAEKDGKPAAITPVSVVPTIAPPPFAAYTVPCLPSLATLPVPAPDNAATLLAFSLESTPSADEFVDACDPLTALLTYDDVMGTSPSGHSSDAEPLLPRAGPEKLPRSDDEAAAAADTEVVSR
jgi:hypothetical protein